MKRAIALIALFLAACGTSPEPAYYDLAAIDGAPLPDVAITIKIQRPNLPAYLDRPDIVREENAYEYKIDEMRRWAEPLDRMFERILAEDLRQRLPNSKIFSDSDTGGIDSRYVVATDIGEFNAVDQNKAVLKAQLSIYDKTKAQSIVADPVEIDVPTGSPAQDIAAALSTLIAGYADHIKLSFNRPKS